MGEKRRWNLAALPEDDLKSCKLGYRCKYVHAAAKAVARGDIDLNSLLTADENETVNALTGLYGVGTKDKRKRNTEILPKEC